MDKTDSELKKDYELSFLLLSAEAAAGVLELLGKHGAAPYEQGPVKPIRLMYLIRKQTSAFFGFCFFTAEPEKIAKIKEELAFLPGVLRFLIITPPVKSVSRERKAPPAEAEIKPPEPAATPVLTNEALEEKLEEILK